MPASTPETHTVGVVVDLDELGAPEQQHGVAGAEQRRDHGAERQGPLLGRAERSGGPVVLPAEFRHLPGAGEQACQGGSGGDSTSGLQDFGGGRAEESDPNHNTKRRPLTLLTPQYVPRLLFGAGGLGRRASGPRPPYTNPRPTRRHHQRKRRSSVPPARAARGRTRSSTRMASVLWWSVSSIRCR